MGVKSVQLAIIILIFSNGANSAYLERLSGQAYYDDVLDITWLSNANLSGAQYTGSDANNWADNLMVDGVSGWRLPSADVNGDNIVVDCFGGGVLNCSDNEFGYLYWESGVSNENQSPFTNIQSYAYWTNTISSSNTSLTWAFDFPSGFQQEVDNNDIGTEFYAWAVHDGDVEVVPIPSAVWLFGSGLLGLVGVARRKA